MKRFLIKQRYNITLWPILIIGLFYFYPAQKKYYLDDDIKNFKDQYLFILLFLVDLAILLGVFIVIFLRRKDIKEAMLTALLTFVLAGGLLFCLQTLFEGAALFINRQYAAGDANKTYLVRYQDGTSPSKETMELYCPYSKQLHCHDQLVNYAYREGLKQNDTLQVAFNKGLLGINYLKTGNEKN